MAHVCRTKEYQKAKCGTAVCVKSFMFENFIVGRLLTVEYDFSYS